MKQPIVPCGVPAALLCFVTSEDRYQLITGRNSSESAEMLGDYMKAVEKARLVATSEVYADSSQVRHGLLIPTLFRRVMGSDHPDLRADASDFFSKDWYSPGIVVSPFIAILLARCLEKLVVVRDRPTAVTSDDLMLAIEPFLKTYDSTEDPLLPPTLVRLIASSIDVSVGARRVKSTSGKTLYVSHADVLKKVPELSIGRRTRALRPGSHIFTCWNQQSA